MSQIGTAKVAIDSTIIEAPIYDISDVDYPVIRLGVGSGSTGTLPFYPLSENPSHDDIRVYHPNYGVMGLHDAATVRTLYESFEDGDLSEYSETTDEYWSALQSSYATDGSWVAAWQGQYNGSNGTAISLSGDGVGWYPQRGDTFGYDGLYRYQTQGRHAFLFGAQTHGGNRPSYPTAYYLRFNGNEGTVTLEYDSYGGDLEIIANQSVDYTGLADEVFSVEIDWGDPTIQITASTDSRGQFVDMQGDDTRLDSGGFGMGAVKNTHDTTDTRLLWDSLYYKS